MAASPDEIEAAVQELTEHVTEVACDSQRWSQSESIEIFEGVISDARQWIDTIRREMG